MRMKKGSKEDTVMIKVASGFMLKIRNVMQVEIIIGLVNIIFCVMVKSNFLAACSSYLFINSLVRYILLSGVRDKSRNRLIYEHNKMYDRVVGGIFLLLITSFVLLGCGISVFFSESPFISDTIAFIISVLTGLDFLISIYLWILIRKYTDLLLKLLRFLIYINAMILFALLVSATMYLFVSEDIEKSVGLTGVVFSLGAAGATAYIGWNVLLTNEQNNNLYHHFRENRTIIYTKISFRKDIVFVLGKVILGVISMSGFMFVNALYSAGMGIAKYNAVRVQDKGLREQIHSFFEIGAGIFGASLCYVIYSLRMFERGKSAKFNMIIALIIAAYTFTELFLIIRDYIKARKTGNMISEKIKLIGLSSTLICVVITQVAIMSISYEGDASFYNGLSGVIFGSLAALIGVYMMIRSISLKKEDLDNSL